MSAHTESHAAGHGVGAHTEPHVASFGSYVAIFGLLMLLTGVTVFASRVDLGFMNVWVAVLIACVKASVVVLFFMHVKYSSPLIKLTAACGFVWLLFMFGLTFADYFGREMITPPKAWITAKPLPPAPAAAEHKE
jgi:cytochrome c oxidase subunit IV